MRESNYADNTQQLRNAPIQKLRLNIIIGLFIFTLLPNFEYGALPWIECRHKSYSF